MSLESQPKNTLQDLDNLFDIEVTDAEIIESSLPSTRPVEEKTDVAVVEVAAEDKEKEDLELARKSLREALEKANGALDDLIYIAKNSEHPRAYEVTSTLINTISATAKQLTEHHKKDKEKPAAQNAPAQVTNNSVFIGSTDELLTLLKKKNSGGTLPGA